MYKNDFINISKVIETSNIDEANKFLNNGWKLLNTYTTTYSYETKDQVNIYVLGKLDSINLY